MITREQLVDLFDSIGENTDWDLAGPMRWGYYFTDPDRQRLERVAPLLEADGYRVVALFPAEPETSDGAESWWLHVERDERHSVASLDARNRALHRFAETHGLEAYDGMDVGPVEPATHPD